MKTLRHEPSPFGNRQVRRKKSKYRNLKEECEAIKQRYSRREQGFRTSFPKHRKRVERSSGYKVSLFSDGHKAKNFNLSTTMLKKHGKTKVMKTVLRSQKDHLTDYSKIGKDKDWSLWV